MGQGQGKAELRAAEEQEMLSLKGSGVGDGWIPSRGQKQSSLLTSASGQSLEIFQKNFVCEGEPGKLRKVLGIHGREVDKQMWCYCYLKFNEA